VRDEQPAGRLLGDRPTAEGQHAGVLGQGVGDRRRLQCTEPLLPLLHEDVGDGAPGDRLDVVVGVAEPHPQGGGDRRAHRGLPRRRRTDEDQDRTAARVHRYRNASR
jgi:hypothetical protein